MTGCLSQNRLTTRQPAVKTRYRLIFANNPGFTLAYTTENPKWSVYMSCITHALFG